MVVSKLERFIEDIDGGMIAVNLRELIKSDSLKKGRRPTILLDQSSILNLFEDQNCSFLYNGQPCLVKKKIEKFVENIISSGANLIVCLRGSLEKSAIHFFVKEKRNIEIRISEIEKLKENIPVLGKWRSVSCVRTTFALLSNEHYQVFNSINRTHVEVANLAVREECLAVIGQDSNYLIYDGLTNYISVRSLNIETLHCKIYNRKRMLEYLGLQSFQLPMFATLCGNDIVPFIFLKEFHKRISNSTQTQNTSEAVLLAVARELRIPPDRDLYKLIKYYVQLINSPKIDESLIEKSLDMYLKYENIQPVNKLPKFLIDKVSKCELNLTLASLVMRKEIYSNCCSGIIDKGLTSYSLFRPLRAQLYSILLPYKSTVKEYFIEEMLLKDKKRPVPTLVFVPASNHKIPGLVELCENRTPEMDILRWNLFCNCISKKLNFSAIRLVPEKLLLPVLALRYLKTEVQSYFPGKTIFKSEIDMEAFLIAALIIAAFPEEKLQTLLQNLSDTEPNLWVYQLTVLYVEAHFFLTLLNEACGFVVQLEKTCLCNFYDGKLIHCIYNKMKKGANCEYFFEGDVVLEVLFYTLLDIIRG